LSDKNKYMDISSSSDKVMYEEISETIDKETGEIIEKKTNKVIKKSKTPDFIMLFTQTSPALVEAKLTTGQTTLLFSLLTGNYITRENNLDISSATRDEIAENTDLSRKSINTLLSQLIKKEIIIKKQVGEKSFRHLLNPFIFGKGNWQNISKLRQEIRLEYDFIENKLTESNSTSTLMDESKEIIDIPHHIVGSSSTVEDGTTHNIIEISESSEEKIHPNQQSFNLEEEIITEPTSKSKIIQDTSKIELIKEENKQLQLKQELMKEESKLLEMKIKAKEMGL